MTYSKYFSKIKAQLKEENDNYNSAFDAMMPNDQEQADLMSAPEDTTDIDKEVKKDKLTAKVIDKIKQTLDVSDELQALLNQIDKINKDTHDNAWEINKKQNTAILPSKNAQIFLQNSNICLSLDGKVELFKDVNELHNFLKDHNLPLPKGIQLHEAYVSTGDLAADLEHYYATQGVSKGTTEKFTKEDQLKRAEELLKPMTKKSKEEYTQQMKKSDYDLGVYHTDNGELHIIDALGNDKVVGKNKEEDEKKEDCSIGGSLGAPVQYQANQDEKLNEEELEERTPKSAGFTGDFIADRNGKIVGYGEPKAGQNRWVDYDYKKHGERLGDDWLDFVRPKDPEGNIQKKDLTFKPENDPQFSHNARIYKAFQKARKSELVGSAWDRFWEPFIQTNPLAAGYGHFIDKKELALAQDKNDKAEVMTKKKLADIAEEFLNDGIGNIYGNIDREDPELLTKLIPMKVKNHGANNAEQKYMYASNAHFTPEFKTTWYDTWKAKGKIPQRNSNLDYLERFLKAHPEYIEDVAEVAPEKISQEVQQQADKKGTKQKLIQPVVVKPNFNTKQQKAKAEINYGPKSKKPAPEVNYGNNVIDKKDTEADKLYKDYATKYNNADRPADVTFELINLKSKYAKDAKSQQIYDDLIKKLRDGYAKLSDDKASDADIENAPDMDETSYNILAALPFNKTEGVSDLGKAFLALRNKNEDVSLKEDDDPADFATGTSAAPTDAAIDTTGLDTSTTNTTTDTTGNVDLNTEADPNMPNAPAGFGDIQINTGSGDYSPDDPNAEAAALPPPDMPEYKIIDVLVNDKDISDIKVKVKDKKTGEVSTKSLSEIDV